jgi:hypothetical protein
MATPIWKDLGGSLTAYIQKLSFTLGTVLIMIAITAIFAGLSRLWKVTRGHANLIALILNIAVFSFLIYDISSRH